MKEAKRLTRCSNGHFYDGGKYDCCPHCQNQTPPEPTEWVPNGGASRPVVSKAEEADKIPADAAVSSVKNNIEIKTPDSTAIITTNMQPDDIRTVHFYQKAFGTEPVVGWLVCTSGVHLGQDFRIKSGRNFIGRSGTMDISLSGDKFISREKHAILTYDPKGNMFMIQPGEDSKELFYVNGEPVLIPTALKNNDIISIGESELVFVQFCSKKFTWEKAKNNETEKK